MVIYQGLLPETESKFINHQLICLIKHMKICGSLRNVWTLSGERALSKIKKFIPEGGQSFDLQTITNYSLWERENMFNFFNNNDISNNIYEYSDQNFSFMKSIKRIQIKNINEINSILYCIINEIKKKCDNYNVANENFYIYKLYLKYIEYLKHLKRKYIGQEYVTLTFYGYITVEMIKHVEYIDYVKNLIFYFEHKCNIIIYKRAIIYGIEMTSLSDNNFYLYSNNEDIYELKLVQVA